MIRALLASEVKQAWPLAAAPFPVFHPTKGQKGAKADGLRYEMRVKAHFAEAYPHFLPGFWIGYTDMANRVAYCQPDGLLMDFEQGILTILEFKLRHCYKAYQQLFDLYLPVVGALFGDQWTYRCLEVCKWYDASLALGKSQVLLPDPLQPFPASSLGVHIWNPAYARK